MKVAKVENGLKFPDFTTIAYYINFGGPVTKIGEAAEAAMHIGVVGTPIGITHRSYFELAQNCAFLAHPSRHEDDLPVVKN